MTFPTCRVFDDFSNSSVPMSVLNILATDAGQWFILHKQLSQCFYTVV
jgi:hypothetical protein